MCAAADKHPGLSLLEPQQRIWHYAFAGGCVAVAGAVRAALGPWLGEHIPFTFFLPAVVMAAWFGGWGPGLAAAVTGAVLADFFFLPPIHALGMFTPDDRAQLVSYALASVFVLVVIQILHTARRKAQALALEAQQNARRLEAEARSRQQAEAALQESLRAMQQQAVQMNKDIDERKRAGEALRESEERLRLAAQVAGFGTFDLDLQRRHAHWSPELNAILGLPPESPAPFTSDLDAVHPEDRELVQAKVAASLDPSGSGQFHDEHRIVRPDGAVRWVLAMGQTFFAGEGADRRPARRVGIVLDTTERKEAELALAETEELLALATEHLDQMVNERTAELNAEIARREEAQASLAKQYRLLDALFQHALMPMVLLDPQFNFIRVNPAYAHADRKQVEDFAGRNHFELYPHPENRAIFEEVVRTKTPYQAFAKPFTYPEHPEWGVTYWDWSVVPVLDQQGEVEFLFFTLKDVTAGKRAEDDLRTAARYARSLLEASPDPLVLINTEGRIIDVNHATEAATGADREQVIGSNFAQYFTEPDQAEAVYQQVLTQGLVRNYPLTLRHCSGRKTEVLYHATIYRDEAGQTQGVFAVARDISERKAMERALRESEARYRSLVSASAQIVWTANAKGEIAADMPAWRAYTGQTEKESHGWGWLRAVHPEDRQRIRKLWMRALETHTPYEAECRLRRQDGAFRHFTVRAVPVLEPDGQIREWVGACTDITEAKAAEKRREVIKALLELFAHKTTSRDYLASVVQVICEWTGAECVGIRLADNEGRIPYAASRGFDPEFLRLEDQLLLQTTTCCCCRAVTRAFEEQDRPILTPGGSYRLDNTFEFIQELPPEKLDRYRGNCIKFGFASVAVVPIRYRDHSLGAIHLADGRPSQFSPASVEFLETMAPLIGEALCRFQAEAELAQYRDRLEELVQQRTRELAGANARLRVEIAERQHAEDTLRRQNQRLELLSESAGQLLSAKDPEQMVRRLFDKVSAQLGLDAYFNFMVNEAGDALRMDSCAGIPEAAARSIRRLEFGQAVCGAVAQLRQPITATHIQESDDPKVQLVRGFGIRAYACNPLMAGDRLLGTLSFATRNRDVFSEDDLKFIRTICHYVAIAKERTRYTQELEQRVAERTAQLRETITELEAYSYTISHDLRAPLRSMQNFAQMLMEDCGAQVGPEGQDCLRRIINAGRRMDRLIQDVLSYSRISRGELELMPVKVAHVAQGILDSSPALQSPQAEVTVEGPLPVVLANETMLNQCLSNLLGNAVKFVAPGVTPRVRLRTEDCRGHVRLWVEDNGIGIPAEHLGRVFALFERFHSNYEGTGIGLAIVRKAVERMGGKVGVESEPGRGSKFWIELNLPS